MMARETSTEKVQTLANIDPVEFTSAKASVDQVISKAESLPSLTGARFFAALAVVAGHYAAFYHLPQGPWSPLFVGGPSAVCFFYILSGFVLTYTYGWKANIGWLSFMQARFARIYPVFLLGLCLGALDLTLGGLRWRPINYVGFLFNLLCLQDWVPQNWFHLFNSPAWSISCEVFFYACFPLLVLNLRKRKWTVNSLFIALIAIYLGEAAVFLSLLNVARYVAVRGWLNGSFGPETTLDLLAYRYPLGRIGEFTMGILLGLWYQNHSRLSLLSRNLLIGGALFATFGILFLLPLRQGYATNGSALLFFWIYVPVFSALVYGLAQGRNCLSFLFENRLILELGEASYGLYVLHDPLLRLFHKGHLFPAWTFVITLVISILSFRLFESPLRILLKSRKPRLKTSPVAA